MRMMLMTVLIGAMLCIPGVTQADDYAAVLKKFVDLVPTDLNDPSGLVFGPWTLGDTAPADSKALYSHTDRAKFLEIQHLAANVTVSSLNGRICGIRAVWDISKPDFGAARTAIFGKLGKTDEVHKNFNGDISYHYRNSSKSVLLYLGTTGSKLVLSMEAVAPCQELYKLKNSK